MIKLKAKIETFCFPQESLKEPFFRGENKFVDKNVCGCRMITRVCAFESLLPKVTFEFSSLGLAIHRKFCCGHLKLISLKISSPKKGLK